MFRLHPDICLDEVVPCATILLICAFNTISERWWDEPDWCCRHLPTAPELETRMHSLDRRPSSYDSNTVFVPPTAACAQSYATWWVGFGYSSAAWKVFSRMGQSEKRERERHISPELSTRYSVTLCFLLFSRTHGSSMFAGWHRPALPTLLLLKCC